MLSAVLYIYLSISSLPSKVILASILLWALREHLLLPAAGPSLLDMDGSDLSLELSAEIPCLRQGNNISGAKAVNVSSGVYWPCTHINLHSEAIFLCCKFNFLQSYQASLHTSKPQIYSGFFGSCCIHPLNFALKPDLPAHWHMYQSSHLRSLSCYRVFWHWRAFFSAASSILVSH